MLSSFTYFTPAGIENGPEHEKEDVQSGGRRRRAPEKDLRYQRKAGATQSLFAARVERMEPSGTAAMCVRPCVVASVAARSVWGSVVLNIVRPAGLWQGISLG